MNKKLFMGFFLLALVIGCDSSGGGSNDSAKRKFEVRYEVSGTFTDACDLFYITRRDDVSPDEENKGGDSRQATTTLPWNHSFEITVTQLHPFNTQIGAVCSANSNQSVDVAIFIDGTERASDSRTGQNVNATAAYQLVHSN